MNKLIKILLVMLVPFNTLSQTIKVEGTVVDAKTGQPVVEAEVLVAGSSHYTLTDFDGKFTLEANQDDKIEVTHIQYTKQSLLVSKYLVVKLEEARVSLDEIIIKSDPLQDISHSVVVMDDIKKGSQSRNVADLFSDIPGFNIQKRSASAMEPSLRSFKYEQMNIKYDGGMKMVNACPNRMDPITAHVIPEEVRKIEVVKGPFTVRFGQSFGGIVNMVTKPPTPEDYGWHGSLQSGFETNGSNIMARGELQYAQEKYDVTFNAENRTFGDYKDGDGVVTKSGFKTNSYSLKLGLNPKTNQRLQLDWRQKFSRDIMHAGLAMDSPIDDSYMIGLDYKVKDVNNLLKSFTIKSYYSSVEHLMTNGYASSDYVRPNYPATDARTPVTSNTMGGKMEFGLRPNNKLFVYAGLDTDIIKRDGTKTVYINNNPATGDPWTQVVKEFKVWQDAAIFDYGAFAEASHKLTDELTTTLGLRTDYVLAGMEDPDPGFEDLYGGEIKDAEDVTFSGNIALKYKQNGWQAQLAYGRGTRTPSMIERYIYRFVIGVDAREYIGNPYLKPEVNNQIEFSINKKWKKLGAGTSLFYSKMTDYITAIINTSFMGAGGGCGGGVPQAPKQYWNVNANQYGFDLFLNYQIVENLKFTSDLAYTIAENETFNEPLAQVAPMSTHLGLKYEKEKYWLDVRTEIIAEQADFSPSFNETKTPGHTTMDFRLGYKPLTGLTFGGAVLNMFDESYYNHLNFSYTNADEYNGRRIYEPGRSFSIYAKYKF